MNPRLIVFDLDGTLSDSQHTIVAVFQQVAHQVGCSSLQDDAIAALIGLPLQQMFQRLMPDRDPFPLIGAFRDAYPAVEAQHTQLFSGIDTLLKQLHATKTMLAIATSKGQSAADDWVKLFELAPVFSLVVGHVPSRRSKPHPDMLLHVLDTLRVKPNHAVMVGDTTFDLQMAHAAGVRPVGVSWGSHSVDALSQWGPVARDVAHLQQLLD
jgi:phosphoglycolate phosphatase